MIMLIILIVENKNTHTHTHIIYNKYLDVLNYKWNCKAKWWLHACIIQICHRNIDIYIFMCWKILEFWFYNRGVVDVHYQNIYHTIPSTTQTTSRIEFLMIEYFTPLKRINSYAL